MFDSYDDVTENLRNDHRYVPVSEALRYLDTGVDPLNWEESEALGKPYLSCDHFEEAANPDIIRILRDRSLVKAGVIKAGYYSSSEFSRYPTINRRNVKWRVFIEGVTPDFSEPGTNEGWHYDAQLDTDIDSVLMCSEFINPQCTEAAASLIMERGSDYIFRWAAIEHLSIERASLIEFAERSQEPDEGSKEFAMDTRERKTLHRLLVAALSKRGAIPENVSLIARGLHQKVDELGLKVCLKTTRNKCAEALETVMSERQR